MKVKSKLSHLFMENMETTPSQMQLFLNFLKDQKAINPIGIDVSRENTLAEGIIVAGAASRRHAQGLADGISLLCSELNYDLLGIEGYELAEWILVDCNTVLVNIFQNEIRDLYRLEELWG